MTVSEIIQGIFVLLKKPKSTDLPIGDVYQLLSDKLEYYLTSMNMSDSNWILATTEVTFAAGSREEAVVADSFGRPILVETTASSGEVYLKREVDIVSLQDINSKHVEPVLQFTAPAPYYRHTATRCAFWKDVETGNQMMRVDPPATAHCTYKIYYEPTGMTKPSITDDTQFIGNFMALLKTDTALSALHLLADVMSDKMYSATESRLEKERERLEAQFILYISNNAQEQAGPITPYQYSGWSSYR